MVDYDEPTIRSALERLSHKGWVRLASGPGSRAIKYRHLLDEALGLSAAEISLLAVLMLRGAQTPGELKARSDRLHPFESLVEVHQTLDTLIGRELVVRLPRRPGQKEERYAQLLGADSAAAQAGEPGAGSQASATVHERIEQLEHRVHALEEELTSLRDALGATAEASAE